MEVFLQPPAGEHLSWDVLRTFSFSWRVLPFIITGIAVYPLTIGFLFVPSDRAHTRDRRVDWLGAVAITGAQVLLTLGLTFSISSSRGWAAPCTCHGGGLCLHYTDIPPILVIESSSSRFCSLPSLFGGKCPSTSANTTGQNLHRSLQPGCSPNPAVSC